MTNKKLKQAKINFYDILNKHTKEVPQYEPLKKWLNKYQVYVPSRDSSIVWWGVAVENAHRFLQTEMMFNACVSSKQSCKWAAIAATVAAIGVIAGWYTYLFKMIILMFKGI